MAHLDRALAEIRRVLKPGGWLYVSEPVYAGEFNEIVKLFHDEGEVRAAAQAAVRRAAQSKVLELAMEKEFMAPLAFRDFADFGAKFTRPVRVNLMRRAQQDFGSDKLTTGGLYGHD